jgi:hypothetical protein
MLMIPAIGGDGQLQLFDNHHVTVEQATVKGGTVGTQFLTTSCSSSCSCSSSSSNPSFPIPSQSLIQETAIDTLEFAEKKLNRTTIVRSDKTFTFDVLAIFLHANSILYSEASHYCSRKLNMLMIPAIVLSAAVTLLSLLFADDPFGPTTVSVLGVVNSCILAIITYLKLDARAEAHRTSAYKFDKLITYCRFQSGLFYLSHSTTTPPLVAADGTGNEDSLIMREQGNRIIDHGKFTEIIKYIEDAVCDIQELNQFILPDYIRRKHY